MPITEYKGILYYLGDDGASLVPLGEIHDLSTEIINETEDFCSFEPQIGSVSRRDLYLWQLKTGIFDFRVPNNFRRMNGVRARRTSVTKRRAEKNDLKLPWKR